MPTLQVNSFTSYSFTEQELREAAILSPLQEARIRHLLSESAEQVLNLTYDPQNPQQFVQDDAHLKGQMSIYRFLLQCHEEAVQQAYNSPRN